MIYNSYHDIRCCQLISYNTTKKRYEFYSISGYHIFTLYILYIIFMIIIIIKIIYYIYDDNISRQFYNVI